MPTFSPKIVLASTSPYKKKLLQQLQIPFLTDSPAVDETPQPGESPQDLALRLAVAKARALGHKYLDHLIIGTDQTAVSPAGSLLTKPGNFARALQQLLECNGKSVTFHTAVAVYNSKTDTLSSCIDAYTVNFRVLSREQMTQYLKIEQPYDCAGSFKVEQLGIRLFDKLEGADPSCLTGLPLISLTNLLLQEGVDPLQSMHTVPLEGTYNPH